MISYSSPVCSATQRPATLLCYTDNCTYPAFACQLEELSKHKHDINGKMNFWEASFPAIQRAIEKELSPNDIAVLEKQEKRL